jgi:hypothetical protein
VGPFLLAQFGYDAGKVGGSQMPSPFPGMNPYLEQADCWEDFHQRYVVKLADMLAALVGPSYIVKIEAEIYVREISEHPWLLVGKGDVGLSRMGSRGNGEVQTSVLEAPVIMELHLEEEKSAFIEIRDKKKRDLVTIVEMLSPTNKYSGKNREQFVAKRTELLQSLVNYIELDFLRGGPRMPLPSMPKCDYYALVRACKHWRRIGFWPLIIRDPLPTIPIPLCVPDADVKLDLQAALHQVYDAAGYAGYIYDGKPEPALVRKDVAWARKFVPPR